MSSLLLEELWQPNSLETQRSRIEVSSLFAKIEEGRDPQSDCSMRTRDFFMILARASFTIVALVPLILCLGVLSSDIHLFFRRVLILCISCLLIGIVSSVVALSSE